MNKAIVAVWILLWSILVVENAVMPTQSLVILWRTNGAALALTCLLVGVAMWIGIKWIMSDPKKWEEYDEGF